MAGPSRLDQALLPTHQRNGGITGKPSLRASLKNACMVVHTLRSSGRAPAGSSALASTQRGCSSSRAIRAVQHAAACTIQCRACCVLASSSHCRVRQLAAVKLRSALLRWDQSDRLSPHLVVSCLIVYVWSLATPQTGQLQPQRCAHIHPCAANPQLSSCMHKAFK